MYPAQAYLDHRWRKSAFSRSAARKYLYVASPIFHRLNSVRDKRSLLIAFPVFREISEYSLRFYTCVRFAVVRAENAMKSQIYFFGMLRDSFADIVRVLPLPVGPTHNTFVSLTRRYPINVALRTLSMVGTSISAKILFIFV